ncbi:hypothetical protein NQ318_022612 [Aromia moschata]|uniref:HTH psq-type domain-containing protein n=1 Tax=Aromia moschata TaxID=1265417 RepID=A0AAV8XDN3_9CUCU|nr:hypothetical protein NQ318_022612 [Aromia moschata]
MPQVVEQMRKMVRDYQRTIERGRWSEETMKQGKVLRVVNGRMGCKRAAEAFGVPQTTLERKVKKFKLNNGDENTGEYSFKEILGPISTEENELVTYIKTMESRLFGLNTNDIRQLAYQLVEKNNKRYCSNHIKQEAGKDWVRGFLKRNMAFNKESVNKFFTLLGEPIYNCDESGISSVSKSTAKILATKEKKQVGSLSSADRGQNRLCRNLHECHRRVHASTSSVRVIQRMKPELNNCSPGMWAECHVRGWMQKEIFEKLFEKFIQFSGATKEMRVLLLFLKYSYQNKNTQLNLTDLIYFSISLENKHVYCE